MDGKEMFYKIESEAKRYLDFLCDICAYETPSEDKDSVDKMNDYIEYFAKKEGFSVSRTYMERCGDFLSIDLNEGASKGCVFLAHTDTVHRKGTFGESPVTRLKDRVIAPGAIDCKGGIAIAMLTMKVLSQCDYPKHIRLILTSDEEVSNTLGGEKELEYFKRNCAGFPCAINCETTEKDEVVISRKGILKYRVDICGLGGHSGIHYFECKNAVEEAAHKILALHQESRKGGITYSCNMIRGGTAPNIIPDRCSITVDIRVPRCSDIAKAESTLYRIAKNSFIKGTSATITVLSKRPPMEQNPQTNTLFEELLATCRHYQLGSLTPVESGGGSDSCYTYASGIPSICGMGGSGEFCHTNNEYISIESIPLRAKILTAFLVDREMKTIS